MAILLNPKEIRKQSEVVFAQFGDLWKRNCEMNSQLPQLDASRLQNSGVGKVMLLAAMGESLEENIDLIKKHRSKFDLVTNDKCFGKLLEHGVKADYVVVCDASIPFEHFKPYVQESKGVKMLATCYANPDWTYHWQGERFFYINRDSIASERVFLPYFNKKFPNMRVIPAGSNVSNAMVVFWTGCDNASNINWGGYARYLLVGYDYSWRADGNYYAWSNPKPKRYYMNHRTMIDPYGNVVLTSENLVFSGKWLYSYLSQFGLPVYNCSQRGLCKYNPDTLGNQLKKINASPSLMKRARELFELAESAYGAFLKANALFEKEKEAVLCP